MYYVTFNLKTHEVLIHCTWLSALKVSGFKKKFLSWNDALNYKNYVTRHIMTDTTHVFQKPCIFFDSGTPNKTLEIRITDNQGNSLLQNILQYHKLNKQYNLELPLTQYTNNVGELLGCFFALMYAWNNNIKQIAGDSELVILFWLYGLINLDVKQSTKKLISSTRELYQLFESIGGRLYYLSRIFNQADITYGYKKKFNKK